MSLLKEYLLWRKEHKTDVARARMKKLMLKHPLNYSLLEEWLQTFLDVNHRDLVIEMEGADYKVKIYYDKEDNTPKHVSMTKQIMEAYK